MTAWNRTLLLVALVASLPLAAGAQDVALADDVVLEGLVFEISSAELTAESLPYLDGIVAMLEASPDADVEVGGHTDSSGPADLNRDLSRRRAETVRLYLIQNGVAAERITAVGYGEDYPVAGNATAEGRAANRRVELKRTDS